MNQKLNLAILCGGQSAEHEISVISAKNIIAALDKNKYQLHIIFINKSGEWFLFSPENFLNLENPQNVLNSVQCQKLSFIPGDKNSFISSAQQKLELDLVFPVLHGAYGEDGTIQGLFEMVNVPYVGAGVLGSAVCMDKEVSKRLLRAAKIPIANFIVVSQTNRNKIRFDAVVKKLGLPLFVKPSNTGSSVGISKVKNQQEFNSAVDLALQYDHKILLEQYIPGQEIECSVLGNEIPEASLPGEIVCHHEFYSYDAKYIDPKGADLVIPAKLPQQVIKKIQTAAKKAYRVLSCEGMARVDFFVTPEHKIYINEANTIPGFTKISMYPKMWEASGLAYSVLLDKLIELALQRAERNKILIFNKEKK